MARPRTTPRRKLAAPNRITEHRERVGMTLEELADATGIHYSHISKMETRARRVTIDHLLKLAGPLRCQPRDLVPDWD